MKKALREETVSLTKAYSEKELNHFSNEIFKNLEQLQVFAKTKCILAYYSFHGEVHTHDFIEKYAREKKIILPVVQKDKLVLREYKGKNDLQRSAYGILEPTGPDFTNFSEIDLAIVPGRMFDRKLNRLGRGKAYYDKLLTNLSAFLVGVCYPFQLIDEIPVEPHDFPMDCVITSDEIIT
ncbi:MAG: 5-formyltetrahydrofolate cyclo-ligase [Dysgonamonadaceae bacterium]|jgi:5-formyltetrahydrofolate cyclo-ligase|nr:5-formyltetrahydrofolate cyclo-ligase [Dysgonamonadaceae bacterium]MDD3355867.1 5-formyltetrahydrofolate cyclo-ligase [Dysgonamonadaceae bacterium]MDD3726878.1 5-formyltetrahydrofolate cyclo-ligase [Dysgonamonadaceae bacterium]MDD4246634.1 5-formyltetrahydrofolate cyclo-ligase [Dysgonamonadaceae bacterium]MDD4605545.1 5-formyltetrahydrofolate cyclo-ligase [Dysgonamonadaceae bacterium]